MILGMKTVGVLSLMLIFLVLLFTPALASEKEDMANLRDVSDIFFGLIQWDMAEKQADWGKGEIRIETPRVYSFDGKRGVVIIGISYGQPRYVRDSIVIITQDGGKTWELSYAFHGMVSEVYFRDRNNVWIITQGQMAGTYPTLYWSANFGQNWSESNNINEWLRSQGYVTVSYARNIRFIDNNHGVVEVYGGDDKEKIYYLETWDGGKSWSLLSHEKLEGNQYKWYVETDASYSYPHERENRWKVEWEEEKGKYEVWTKEGNHWNTVCEFSGTASHEDW